MLNGDTTIKPITEPTVRPEDDLYLQEKDVIDAFLDLPLQQRAVACEVIAALSAAVARENADGEEPTP
ncbi:hypothetical protein HW090_07575 [Pseudomonas sp. ABC1]|uniref:hypothetical protein n=1 Tax=Pseudomonas sp. ABC1 TaxID=2748080 RepID=UPI0015C3D1D2|nr:hypothetical protein [Pseudomonas sp. ABC1]QLF93053.1 hypothetical protein HW090_07575 [Pseudomonas sp. ABC1]